MDYLPIQASSVPCERVFSSSSETDTKKRNRLSATLMEALQMLKYDFKKQRLNFTMGVVLSQHDLLDDEPDEPVEPVEGVPIFVQDLDSLIGLTGNEEGDQFCSDVVFADFPS